MCHTSAFFPLVFPFSAASEPFFFLNILCVSFCHLFPLSRFACMLLETSTNVFQECLCVSLTPDGLGDTWLCISLAVSKFWVVDLSFRSNTASPKRSTNSPRASARGSRDRFVGESYTVLGELNLFALLGKADQVRIGGKVCDCSFKVVYSTSSCPDQFAHITPEFCDFNSALYYKALSDWHALLLNINWC